MITARDSEFHPVARDNWRWTETTPLSFSHAAAGILGNLYIAAVDSKGDCKIIGSVASKRSARTITIDKENHEVFLPAADLGKGEPGKRPPVIPGSFEVLVFAK